MRKGSALLSVVVTVAAASGARAAVIDTYTRADVAPVTDSIGQTEAGGYDYVERGNNPTATIANGTAEIVGGELKIYGRLGAGTSDTGGVYLTGYDSADVTLSTTVRFEHNIAAPTSTEELANTYLVALRSRPDMNFAPTSAANRGVIGVEFGPNGDVLVREIRTATGTLTTVVSGNLITGGATTRRRLTPGALPSTFNGLPFDTDQDGFIDGSESFTFGVDLSGTTLKLYVNGLQVGTNLTLAETTGIAGNGVGLHKNRVSSAFETVSDIFVDDVNLAPIPEPASLSLLAVSGLALARPRRRRRI
jgi:hypothetical protein